MPTVHGLEGSAMITSYSCGSIFRTVRASSWQMRTRLLVSTPLFSIEKNFAACSTGSQFSATVKRLIG